MRINRYEFHNVLLISIAFGRDVFIVVHPLHPKDDSVDLRSALPSSDILRAEVMCRENPEIFCFLFFHLVIRTENHICLILLYDLQPPFSKETSKERQLKKNFSPKNVNIYQSNRCKFYVKVGK
jgi:hypothetical protein